MLKIQYPLDHWSFPPELPLVLFCDNKAAISLSENPIVSDKSKHIDIQFHHIRNQVANRTMKVEHLSTDLMTTDIFTKALPKDKFQPHRTALGFRTM
jgi:hypothetical protein